MASAVATTEIRLEDFTLRHLPYEAQDGEADKNQVVKQPDWFGRDGLLVLLFERAPFVGSVIAAVQFTVGNDDRGKRALAHCANSSIVSVGIIVGVSFSGPIGAVIGAGIATPMGIAVERFIAGKIKDPALRSQFEPATAWRFIYESSRNMFSAGIASLVGRWSGDVCSRHFYRVYKGISASFAKSAGNATGDIVSYVCLKKISDAAVKKKEGREVSGHGKEKVL
ncbi:cnvh-domain-containing protein [Moniliophthora roreri]|uniref:Uncharacterized protein n=1 Tax=Moniliophthora roreri TaxID=221103 RepID=A0A0W0G930_MONRR|nr:cnvh-domain-containing protein [Moniliophthora roreri]